MVLSKKQKIGLGVFFAVVITGVILYFVLSKSSGGGGKKCNCTDPNEICQSDGTCACKPCWEKDKTGKCANKCVLNQTCNNGVCDCDTCYIKDKSGKCITKCTDPNGMCQNGVCICNTCYIKDKSGKCITKCNHGTCTGGVCNCETYDDIFGVLTIPSLKGVKVYIGDNCDTFNPAIAGILCPAITTHAGIQKIIADIETAVKDKSWTDLLKVITDCESPTIGIY